jgi:hypothetical protein
VATVNDARIDRAELLDVLVAGRGLPVLHQLVLREAAAQEGIRRGLSLTDEDVTREYDLTLQAEHFNGHDVENLTPARREQMIADWTRTRGITREELHIAMVRQAWLRKLVGPPAAITDDALREEHARVHGEKVEVRHIQLQAPRYYEPLKARLDRGERFEDLVPLYSQNITSREKAGLLPPFSRNDTTVPPVFAEAAFALAPGETSKPIEAEGSFHVLRLERRLPADGVPLDSVRGDLRRRLQARRQVQAMQDLGSRLLMQSRLQINDPALREAYRAHQADGRLIGPVLVGQ